MMEVDYFSAGFRKCTYLFLVLLIVGCRGKDSDPTTSNRDKTEISNNNQCTSLTNSSLKNELEKFIITNPLSGAEGNAYILIVSKRNNDTVITINRSFKPVLADTSLNYVGAFYHREKPILLIDQKKPLGNQFYDKSCLDKELYAELGKAEHPTSLYKDFVSSTFKVVNDSLTEK